LFGRDSVDRSFDSRHTSAGKVDNVKRQRADKRRQGSPSFFGNLARRMSDRSIEPSIDATSRDARFQAEKFSEVARDIAVPCSGQSRLQDLRKCLATSMARAARNDPPLSLSLSRRRAVSLRQAAASRDSRWNAKNMASFPRSSVCLPRYRCSDCSLGIRRKSAEVSRTRFRSAYENDHRPSMVSLRVRYATRENSKEGLVFFSLS